MGTVMVRFAVRIAAGTARVAAVAVAVAVAVPVICLTGLMKAGIRK